MKRIISMMFLAVAAICFVACEEKVSELPMDDNTDGDVTYGLSGDQYVGTLTVATSEQSDIVFYADVEEDGQSVTIMMPEVSFMVGLMPSLDLALTDLELISEDPDTFYADESQMVGIYDRLPLINDVVTGISEVEVVIPGDNTITVSFVCSISTDAMGDMDVTVTFEGSCGDVTTDDEADSDDETPSFSMDFESGFYVTNSSGETLIEDVSVIYYEGDQTLVVNGFSYSAYLTGTTLPILGVTYSEVDGVVTISADSIDVYYTVMDQETIGTVTALNCEIIDNEAQLEFTISASAGGSGTASEYPCTFSGEITINEGNYITHDTLE